MSIVRPHTKKQFDEVVRLNQLRKSSEGLYNAEPKEYRKAAQYFFADLFND